MMLLLLSAFFPLLSRSRTSPCSYRPPSRGSPSRYNGLIDMSAQRSWTYVKSSSIACLWTGSTARKGLPPTRTHLQSPSSGCMAFGPHMMVIAMLPRKCRPRGGGTVAKGGQGTHTPAGRRSLAGADWIGEGAVESLGDYMLSLSLLEPSLKEALTMMITATQTSPTHHRQARTTSGFGFHIFSDF
jgi:hypothetical protein